MYKKMKKLFSKPENLFVLLAAISGLLTVWLMPVLSAPDENQHFQVEYAIFSSKKQAPLDLVANESIAHDQAKSNYGAFFVDKSSAASDGVEVNFGSKVFDGKTDASAKDILRLPQAIGVLLGRLIYPSLGVMVTTGRIVNLLVYVTILYFIIKHVRYGKWIFLFLACIPMMIQQAASLSYDSNNLLVIFAWVAFVINLATQKNSITKKQTLVGVVLVFFMLISKANNILLLALLFGVPLKNYLPKKLYSNLTSRKDWARIKLCATALTIVGVLLAVYIIFNRLLSGNEFHPRRLLDVLLNTFLRGNDLVLIDVVTTGVVGFFSNFYYHLPVWCVVLTFIVFVVGLLSEEMPRVPKKLALISGLLFFGSVLAITIGMYYAWAIKPFRLGPDAKVADGIQGRYFTPLLILLAPLFAYLQKFISIDEKGRRLMPSILVITSASLLALFLYQTWFYFWA